MKIRSYQKDMVKAQRKFMLSPDVRKGKIFSPTGSGKTVVFDVMIDEEFKRGDEENTKKKICIVYPRIALALDQQGRLREKKNVEFTSFHSGGVEASVDTSSRKQIGTTSVEELKEIIDTTDRHHITISSYQSFNKIAAMDFDLIICDEAHYLVQRQFSDALEKIESKVIFYTATPINATDELINKELVNGMNNERLFGKDLCNIKPQGLIEKGYIVKPLLVELRILTDEQGCAIKHHIAIAHAFKDQKKRLNKITNKMLVAMSNTQNFSTIENHISEMNGIIGSNIDLYIITAGTQRKNGVNMISREVALKDFDENKRQSIILHCDTLAEGIDVPGITGVFIFRGLSKAKFIQTVGRAARPCSADMDDDGEVIDIFNRLKPNAIVTIARVDNKYYANIDSQMLCEAFIEGGYGDSVKDITQFIDEDAVSDISSNSNTNAVNANSTFNKKSLTYSHINDITTEKVKLNLLSKWIF